MMIYAPGDEAASRGPLFLFQHVLLAPIIQLKVTCYPDI